MKALSLRPEWAMQVLLGAKTVECRTWQTSYRGDLVICASSHKTPCAISGYALCKVQLTDIVPFKRRHLHDALMDEMPDAAYAWMLDGLEWIVPFAVKGKLHLYDLPDDLVKVIPTSVSDREALKTFYEPLMYFGRDQANRKIWDDLLRTC